MNTQMLLTILVAIVTVIGVVWGVKEILGFLLSTWYLPALAIMIVGVAFGAYLMYSRNKKVIH